jgi:O-antigen/teichoic acid export membrane protein
MRLLGMGLGYLFALVIARSAGPEAWGAFTLSWSVATLGVVVGRLGIDTALLRFTANTGRTGADSTAPQVVRRAYAIVLVAATVTMTSIIVSSDAIAAQIFGKPELAGPIRIIGAAVLPAALLAVGSQLLRGFGHVTAHVFYQNVGRYVAALALLPLALIFFDMDIAFLWAFACGYFALAGVGSLHAMLVLRRMPNAARASSGEAAGPGRLLGIGSSMTIASILLYFRSSIGLLLVGAMMPMGDVGIFHIALRVAALVALPLFGVNTIAAPRFAESYRNSDADGIEETARIAGVVVAAMAIPAALVLLVAPARVLSIFGPEFTAAAVPLRWLTVGQAANALAGPVGYLLLMTGREAAYRNITVGVVATTAALYALLVPSFGLTGAAIADCAGLLLWNGVLLVYARSQLGIWPLPRPRDLLYVRTWAREAIRQAQAT